MQSNMPLSHCSVDDVLTEVTPYFDESLLQTVDVAYPGAVEASLEHSPDFIVDWIEMWGIWRPDQR